MSLSQALPVVAALTLIAAAPAAAADRYASEVGGDAAACTEADPCSFTTAVDGAGAGDTIRVGPGEHTLPAAVEVLDANLTIVGSPVDPRPVIRRVGGDNVLRIYATGVTLRDVSFEQIGGTGAAVVNVIPSATGFLGERLRIRAYGGTDTAILITAGGVLRDSLAYTEEALGVAILGGNGGASLSNVTARATGVDSSGFYTSSGYLPSSTTTTFRIVNSIVRGTRWDIEASGDVPTGRLARVEVDHSSFDTRRIESGGTLVEGAGNQSAPPILEVDDTTQLAGSPTIDGGRTWELLGTLDVRGRTPRNSGPAPDIGAHEVPVPPTPPPGPTPTPPPPVGQLIPPIFDDGPPTLTKVGMTRKRFTRRQGSAFTVTLDQPARITVTVTRPTRGLRVRGRCRTATRALRRRNPSARQCTLQRPLGRITRAGKAGVNRLAFKGRVGTRTLAPGAYRASIAAVDPDGNAAKPVALTFTILRR